MQIKNWIKTLLITSVILITSCNNNISKHNNSVTISDIDKIKWHLETPADKDGIEKVHHTYFSYGYVEEWEQPAWVAYKLTSVMVKGTVSRTDNFREDYAVSTVSSFPGDYSDSDYDRGHLCPAGDMTFSELAMSETFYMSNMSPQMPTFNRGIWKKLESLIREWAIKENELYIVTGPIIQPGYSQIGYMNKVAVPQYYYKVILRYEKKNKKAIGLILPNEGSQQPLSTFAVSVDSVESMTGLDFFPNLPDDEEKEIESTLQRWKWQWVF